ncbi:putative lipoprotein, partial [Acinetobacter baumannii 1406589]
MANSNILMGGSAAVVIACLIGLSYIPSKPKDEDVSYIQTSIANDEYYAFLSKYAVDN